MKFYILGGLPGSGKSTTCRVLKNTENCFPVSSDSIRLALNAGNPGLLHARLALAAATGHALCRGLNLLGIDAPDRM